jgi:transcriptional regulator with XRE-family HTH domain
MPGIGETLREARMRRRIDMAEVETATKIRAKYLRALENEEWSLLPGTTFVKTFLRTYAEYLELDARTLVEEYKQRYERPAHGELAPFGGLGGPRSRPQRQRPRRRARAAFGPAAVVVIGVVAILAALYLLGISGPSSDPGGGSQSAGGATATPTPTPTPRKRRKPPVTTTPKTVGLQIEATGDVYVCLTDAGGRRLLDGATLHAGDRSKRFTSRRLHARFGNGSARMRVGSKRYPVAASSAPVDYELRPGRSPRRLPTTTATACK